MTGRVLSADSALAVIRGERKATDFLGVVLVSLTAGDELERALRKLPADELPGFCRVLQRHIEARR